MHGDVWRAGPEVAAAAIVVCHGFKGFKEWGFFPWLCEALARGTRLPAVSFNFTGSGIGEDLQTFTELDRFSRNTLSRELEDLEAVLDRLSAGKAGELELPPVSRFGLLGHSRGGAVAVLKAALRTQVRALVTWAALARVQRYEEWYGEDLERDGVVWIRNVRTGQRMPLRRPVLDDLRAHRDRLDPVVAAGRLRIPFLAVHGAEDKSVPPDDSRALAEAGGGRLEVVPKTGHTFGAGHPFGGAGPDLERVATLSVAHFRRHLAP